MPTTRADIAASLRSRSSLSMVRGGPRMMKTDATHLYFLSGRDGALYRAPLASLSDGFAPEKLDISVKESAEPMSKEEAALRERTRSELKGITAFTLGTAAARNEPLMFVSCSAKYFVANRDGTGVRDVLQELKSCNTTLALDGAWMDVKHNPTDLLNFSFVCGNNLFIANLRADPGMGGTVRQVTSVGTPIRACAVADYIMQEEFSLFSGNWWAPSGRDVLFTVTDVSQQREVSILDKNLDVERIPFPRVGDPNAVTSLVVASASAGATGFRMLPIAAIKAKFPWAEYIPRMGWRNAETVYALVLSRDQERSALVEVPVAAMVEVGEAAFFEAHDGAMDVAAIRILREKYIPWAWCEVTDDIAVGADGSLTVGAHDDSEEGKAKGSQYQFFRLSAKDAAGENPTAAWKSCSLGGFGAVFGSLDTTAADGSMYCIANVSRCMHGLCRIAADGSSVATLSPADRFVSSFTVLPEGRGIAYISSTLTEASSIAFVAASPDAAAPSTATFAPPMPVDAKTCADLSYGVADNNEHGVLHYKLRVPKGDAPAEGWPLMLYIYGGPHIQLVRKDFAARCELLPETLCALGVAVATVDNEMHHADGLVAHSVCKKRMGNFETAAYTRVVNHLVGGGASVPLNRARVGVYGWSYGGYATLLAMSQAPDVFKIGLAGAPVGDWRLYDTGYTERYMGLVEDAAEAYTKGSIPEFAAGFPDEPDRLFIAHGTTDENVHLTNSTIVIDALVKHNKPYSLLLYAGERHGLRQDPQSRLHYDTSLVQTVLTHL